MLNERKQCPLFIVAFAVSKSTKYDEHLCMEKLKDTSLMRTVPFSLPAACSNVFKITSQISHLSNQNHLHVPNCPREVLIFISAMCCVLGIAAYGSHSF